MEALEEPVAFLDAEIATADSAAEYSFVVRVVDGNVEWPMVPVGFIDGNDLVAAWPGGAGAQYGGPHFEVSVPAAATA